MCIVAYREQCDFSKRLSCKRFKETVYCIQSCVLLKGPLWNHCKDFSLPPHAQQPDHKFNKNYSKYHFWHANARIFVLAVSDCNLSSAVGFLWITSCTFEPIYFNLRISHSNYVDSVAVVTSPPILLIHEVILTTSWVSV